MGPLTIMTPAADPSLPTVDQSTIPRCHHLLPTSPDPEARGRRRRRDPYPLSRLDRGSAEASTFRGRCRHRSSSRMNLTTTAAVDEGWERSRRSSRSPSRCDRRRQQQQQEGRGRLLVDERDSEMERGEGATSFGSLSVGQMGVVDEEGKV